MLPLEPLPPGSRLVHIGPAKTGTTTLQSAFHRNRPALAEHGVHYAGAGRHSSAATKDAVRRSPLVESEPTGAWEPLAAEIRASTADRVVLSSESLAHADDHAAAALLDDIGRDHTYVVMTMRPLADMLSSSWWQFVQSGWKISYEEWLDGVLRTDPAGTTVTPVFWRRTRIDVVAERWARELGAERVLVVSLADRPRDFLLRVFEGLTALPEGTLVPASGQTNATLPYPVAELARSFNEVVSSQGRDGRRLFRSRMVGYDLLKNQAGLLADDRRIETPLWAVERAGELAAEMNQRIREAGVTVVGDLDALTRPSKPPAARISPPPTEIPISDAAVTLYCMMRGLDVQAQRQAAERLEKARRRQAQARPTQARRQQDRRVRPEDLGGRELLRLLGRRVRRRLRGGRRR